jgi:C1A family cysteine protease
VASYTALPANDPNSLLNAVAKQVVSIGLYASESGFFYYHSGVYDPASCATSINHAVTLIGYGHDAASGKDYWLVKNSWGT